MSETNDIVTRLVDLAGGTTMPPQRPEVIFYNLRLALVDTLEALEVQTAPLDRDYPENYEDMLKALRDAITNRLNNHRWQTDSR